MHFRHLVQHLGMEKLTDLKCIENMMVGCLHLHWNNSSHFLVLFLIYAGACERRISYTHP